VEPETYDLYGRAATAHGLLFSFNANPGYDQIEPRLFEPESCYSQPPFAPRTEPAIDWERSAELERAAAVSTERITKSFDASVVAQTTPQSANAQRGFFLIYLTSFNEWHEGHAFEPMKDRASFNASERRQGYRNPLTGDYRLRALAGRIQAVQARRPLAAVPV